MCIYVSRHVGLSLSFPVLAAYTIGVCKKTAVLQIEIDALIEPGAKHSSWQLHYFT